MRALRIAAARADARIAARPQRYRGQESRRCALMWCRRPQISVVAGRVQRSSLVVSDVCVCAHFVRFRTICVFMSGRYYAADVANLLNLDAGDKQRSLFTPGFGKTPHVLAGRDWLLVSIKEGLNAGPGDPRFSTILLVS